MDDDSPTPETRRQMIQRILRELGERGVRPFCNKCGLQFEINDRSLDRLQFVYVFDAHSLINIACQRCTSDIYISYATKPICTGNPEEWEADPTIKLELGALPYGSICYTIRGIHAAERWLGAYVARHGRVPDTFEDLYAGIAVEGRQET